MTRGRGITARVVAIATVVVAAALGIVPADASATALANPSSSPNLAQVRVSRAHLVSTGGHVRISAAVQGAQQCRLRVRPTVPVALATKACRTSKVHWRVRLPANRSEQAITYHFAVIARGKHHERVVRHRQVTVSHAPTPHLHSLAISTHSLPNIGGAVRLRAKVAKSTRCWLTSTPRMQGLPLPHPCRGSSVSWRLLVPPNPRGTPVHYTLALHARGIGDQVVTRRRSVTVAAQSPTCPGQTSYATPTTQAFFNDPTTGQAADRTAVVDAMINLICNTSPARDGVPAEVDLAMYVDELPAVGDALIWAHQFRFANVHVVLDGANAEFRNASGDVEPNPAYEDLLTGLPAGSVVLCGDNAGQVPLPSDGDIRGAPRRTRASSTAVPVQAGTACAGDNILHAKLLTISSIDVNGDSAVFTSSQNLSQHSEQLAFNNALQLIGSAPMYQANVTYLHALRADTRSPDLGDAIDPLPVDTPIGSVTSAFFPRNSPAQFPADNSYDATNDRATDATAALLQHVSCTSPGTYAGDHAGTVPRTTVRIAVYSYGARNLVTKRLTALAGAGCEVQVIYTRMPLSTYDALVAGGITPVQLNDSSYQLPNGNTTRVFVHDKYLLISGAYNDGGTVVRNQDIVQTGSQNLTPVGLHHNDDEVMRVRQTASKNSNNTALFAAYEANWQHLLAVAGG